MKCVMDSAVSMYFTWFVFVSMTVSSVSSIKAVCVLRPGSDKMVFGTITLSQDSESDPTDVTGTVNGLSAGLHGFHVHQLGDYSQGCKSFGGHYNPLGQSHGAPNATVRHAGDLGNIEAGADGMATVNIQDVQIPLSGEHSIIGRGFVIHAGTDDLGLGGDEGSLKTGNAGARLACCVIGLAK